MNILGICGSLRLESSNAAILKAVKNELSDHHWSEFNIAKLPFFDPDNQFSNDIPSDVISLRSLAAQADCLFISTPEYAHGIPGILKNAMEWIFHEGTQKKPIFIIIGSGQGENTRDQLIEVLTTMDFKIDANQILIIKGLRSKIDTDGNFIDHSTKQLVIAFCEYIVQSLNK